MVLDLDEDLNSGLSDGVSDCSMGWDRLSSSNLTLPTQSPGALLLRVNNAVVNDHEEVRYSKCSAKFYTNKASIHINEQLTFNGVNFTHAMDHFSKNTNTNEQNSRDDIYSQSIRSRLLNLLSGKSHIFHKLIMTYYDRFI